MVWSNEMAKFPLNISIDRGVEAEKEQRKDSMGLEELLETCMLMAQYVKFFLCLHSGPNS